MSPLQANSKIQIQQRLPAAPVPLRQVAARPTITVEATETGSGNAVDFNWQGGQHFLALHDIKIIDGETRVGDLRATGANDLVDTLTLVPAGLEVSGWSQNAERRNGFVAVYLDPGAITRDLAEVSASVELKPKLYFRSQIVRQTVQKLHRCLTHPETTDTLYMDALGVVLSVELWRAAAADTDHRKTGATLSRKQLQQVTDAIESSLDSPLALQSLADIAGLSRFHFLRAFKASAGLSPHQFVLSKRIAKARELLEGTRLPISEISRLAGFGSAAHFARVFHVSVGMTPSDYRNSCQ
ncbi:MAG: helix-turn-helix transcriptional regulator [Hyphomonadaceae bacterium]|nr:helix-turn-helix transcriptional regulator [Hyphomonadaceae bacterium]